MTNRPAGALLEPPVPAPVAPAPRPSRSRRATRAKRRVRRRFWLVALPLAAVIAAASVLVGDALRPGRAGPGRSAPPGTTAVPVPVAPRQTVVVAHAAPTGALDFAALVTSGGDPAFGQVTVLPTAASVTLPGYGSMPVRGLATTGGPEFVTFALEAVSGVRIDQVASLDDAGLQAVLDTVGDLEVSAPVARTVAPADAFALLTADPSDTAPQRAVFEALLDALRDPLRSGPVLDVAPSLAPLVVAAATDAPFVDVSATSTPEGPRLDADAIAPVVSTLPIDVKLGVGGVRPAVGVKDGVGDQEKVNNAVRCLVRAGADIKRIDPIPAYQFDRTAITYADAVQQPTAQRLRDALGVGQVAPQPGGANSFDIAVFVGADFDQCAQ